MTAYVPGYEHDVFVSYSHVDNVTLGPDDDQQGWVDTLVGNLRALLAQKLGRRDQFDVWMDPRLSGHESFSTNIEEVLAASATLLVILSEGYLASEWCSKERECFLGPDGGPGSRVFAVHQTEIAPQRRPAVLRDLLGYPFFRKEGGDGPVRTLGMPTFDPKDQHYYQVLDDLTNELAQHLRRAAAIAESSAGVPGADGVSSAQATGGDAAPDENTAYDPDTATVFLAESTVDVREFWDSIKRHLEQAKIRVLPRSYYDRAPQAFRQAMEKDLGNSNLFVQLLGRFTSPKTADLPSGYEGLQLDLAQAAGSPILRWHGPDIDLRYVDDPELFAREQVLQMGFEDFKREIEVQARRQLAKREVDTPASEYYALVNANSCDLEIAQQVCSVLQDHAMGYEIADENDSLQDLTEQEDYDALMVVYGSCEPDWVQEQVRACRRVLLRRKADAPVCAVYLEPSDAHVPLKIRPPRFHFIDGLEQSLFQGFVSAIQTRAAGQ